MTQPPSEWGNTQLREHLRLTPTAWLVLTGSGKKPKVWTYALMRPCPTNTPQWQWCGNIRKGRGWRYEGRWVAEFWQRDESISIEAAFKDEADALEFLTAQAKRYLP